MRWRWIAWSAALALGLMGCPKRQTTPVVVYVPSPPSSGAPEAGESGSTLTVEEPETLPPATAIGETPTTDESPQKSEQRTRHRPASSEIPAKAEPAPTTIDQPAPTAPVPALEPRESPQQQNQIRSEVLTINQASARRIAQLEKNRISGASRKTLEDARAFLAQSDRAVESDDLQRAFNLARKASLLVDALEQRK